MKVIYINDSNWFNEDVRGLILFLCVSRGNFDGSDIDDLLFLHLFWNIWKATAALDMCEVTAQLIGKKCQYRPFVLVVPADILLYVKLNFRSLNIDSLLQEKCLKFKC